MRRRAVLVAVGLGLTGCVGSQDDENPGQAEGNTTENETDSVENTSDEETTAEEEEEPAEEPANEYTDVEDDVYTVESVGSGEYRITVDEERLIGTATPSYDIIDDEDTAELLQVSDGKPEIYSKGITEEGNAVWFYDDDFADEEPVKFYALWKQGAHVEGVDDPEKEILHETAKVPDDYLDKVEDGLYKATIPFDDLYEDWNDLDQGATVSITLGHLGDTVVEKGRERESDPDATWYGVATSNHPEDA